MTDFNSLVKLIESYNTNVAMDKTTNTGHELEAKFGTAHGSRSITKTDYTNVIHKLKSLGFDTLNPYGIYRLSIFTEFLDARGRRQQSNVRTEIYGLNSIQKYCATNQLSKLVATNDSIEFIRKMTPKNNNNEYIKDVQFPDFNCKVTYKIEEDVKSHKHLITDITSNWTNYKKMFRFINRVTFTHPDHPLSIDISIVKSSSMGIDEITNRKTNIYTYTIQESNVFSNAPSYEIEAELLHHNDNGSVLPPNKLILSSFQNSIKWVLSGMQMSNYPIPLSEQTSILASYMTLLHGNEYDKTKRVYSKSFIGPSSLTLQIQNIIPLDSNNTSPNIRHNYTVTEKADGQRHMLYINEIGRIYLISNNMGVKFTGTKSTNKLVFNSLLDGELIQHNKRNEFINLFACFDIYYVNSKDVRSYAFMCNQQQTETRIKMLVQTVQSLKLQSIISADAIVPMLVNVKSFYIPNQQTNIFNMCNIILNKEFEYNTDGLIFTPALLGVGSHKQGVAGDLKLTTWNQSFKWKPEKQNTVDFLVSTIKSSIGQDVVTPIFEGGVNVHSAAEIPQYKSIILRCGYNEQNDPKKMILDDIPIQKDKDANDMYKPVRFYPSDPYDENAGITNILLKQDSIGVRQMETEDGEIFEDNTIVEFRYNKENKTKWRWIPIKVRYDKTAELQQGHKNYGNAYHVANNNWYSIHNPITANMLSTGIDIPIEAPSNPDVYYDNNGQSCRNTSNTRALQDFHNMYVKRKLISGVASVTSAETLIDFAVGKGGDIPKWIDAKLSFVFGIDYSNDNLENKLNGAYARYLSYKKDYNQLPGVLFVHGDSSKNIKNKDGLIGADAKRITDAVFGIGDKNNKMEKTVHRYFGRGIKGFDMASCQFAIHYFFETQHTLHSFIKNVAECTKLNGHFIGTCYDGFTVFRQLARKKIGESIHETSPDGDSTKYMWKIQKEYDQTTFNNDHTSVGYKINVFQESINKAFSEYLVNFEYLKKIFHLYGFDVIKTESAHQMGLPSGSGMFSELFDHMKKRNTSTMYGKAAEMSQSERRISFLNRYFIFKRTRNIDIEQIYNIHNPKQMTSTAIENTRALEEEEEEEEEKHIQTQTHGVKSNTFIDKTNKFIKVVPYTGSI